MALVGQLDVSGSGGAGGSASGPLAGAGTPVVTTNAGTTINFGAGTISTPLENNITPTSSTAQTPATPGGVSSGGASAGAIFNSAALPLWIAAGASVLLLVFFVASRGK